MEWVPVVLMIIWGHYYADFILQSREMALSKSKSFKVLADHCSHHSGVYFIFLLPFVGLTKAALFGSVNAFLHGIVDWNIWRGYKHIHSDKDINTFRYWETHGFWSVVGLDQALHYTCLLLTAWWLL